MFSCSQTSNVNEVTPIILYSSRVVIIDMGECYDANDEKGTKFVAHLGNLFSETGQVIVTPQLNDQL
jgi:hypothetical protein